MSYFTTTKKLNQQQVQCVELLTSYNFQIHYQKESENRRANALSRRLNLITKETQEQLLFIGKEIIPVLNKPEIATLYQGNTSRQKEVPERDQKKVISKHYNTSLLRHPR